MASLNRHPVSPSRGRHPTRFSSGPLSIVCSAWPMCQGTFALWNFRAAFFHMTGKPESGRAATPRGTQSLERGVELLLALGSAKGGVRLNELAETAGLSLATAHRLIGALMRRGVVERLPGTKLYV